MHAHHPQSAAGGPGPYRAPGWLAGGQVGHGYVAQLNAALAAALLHDQGAKDVAH